MCSHHHQSVFVLLPSVWYAEIAAPNRKPSGKRRLSVIWRSLSATPSRKLTRFQGPTSIGGLANANVRLGVPSTGPRLAPSRGIWRRALMTEVLARLTSRAVALGLGGLMLIACTAGGGGGGGGASSTDVTVWSAWGGQELKAFQDVLKPFEQKEGIKVHLTTVRDANQLAINVDAGTSLPDIANGPTVDKVKDWVSKGVMTPVETALGGQFQNYMTNTYQALTTPPGGGKDDLYIGVVSGKHYELMV